MYLRYWDTKLRKAILEVLHDYWKIASSKTDRYFPFGKSSLFSESHFSPVSSALEVLCQGVILRGFHGAHGNNVDFTEQGNIGGELRWILSQEELLKPSRNCQSCWKRTHSCRQGVVLLGMLSLIRHLPFQEASSVKAEINEGLWQISCTSSAACPVKKNSSLQMIYVMFMAHWLFQSKESDFKMCPILDVCGVLAD